MAKDDDIVHLLLLTESQNDGEQLVSMLRNAGFATRAHHVSGSADLEQVLEQRDWDLFLARPQVGEFTAYAALERLSSAGKRTPLIILADAYDPAAVAEGLRRGGADVVPQAEQERLLLVIRRELARLEEYKRGLHATAALDEADKRCELLLQSSRDAIAYVHEGMHIYANEEYQKSFNYDDPEDLECTPLIDLITDKETETLKACLRKIGDGESTDEQIDCDGERSDGTIFPIRVLLSPARYDGEPCTQVLIRARGVDEEAFAEKLKEISSHDQLTGLFNRVYFQERIEEAIAEARKTKAVSSLYYIALQDFDRNRSEVGISGADVVLKEFARELAEAGPRGKILARFSDDVFTMLVPSETTEEATGKAVELRENIEKALFEAERRTVRLNVCIGLAPLDKYCNNANEVITRAHGACEEARLGLENEGSGVASYDPEKSESEGGSGAVEKLQRAIEGEKFKVLFQPVVNLRGNSEQVYEATIRLLSDDTNEELPPAKFLEIAAEAGLGDKVDRWATLHCIKSLAAHRADGHLTRLMINLSYSSLVDQTFADWVGVALKSANLPPDSIIFQFRTSEVTNFLKQAKQNMDGLSKLGCKICIKHFGSATDSSELFDYLDIDLVKIDGSFTKAATDKEGKARLKEMLTRIKGAGKAVIVPMVDSANIISTLWQSQVDYIQGYYLQAPSETMSYNFDTE